MAASKTSSDSSLNINCKTDWFPCAIVLQIYLIAMAGASIWTSRFDLIAQKSFRNVWFRLHCLCYSLPFDALINLLSPLNWKLAQKLTIILRFVRFNWKWCIFRATYESMPYPPPALIIIIGNYRLNYIRSHGPLITCAFLHIHTCWDPLWCSSTITFSLAPIFCPPKH